MDPNILKNLQSADTNTVIGALKTLRQNGANNKPKYPMDLVGFQTIVAFIRKPDSKLLGYSLSILANYCAYSEYRRFFKNTHGFRPLILILKTAKDSNILCRAWRLVGNLANSPDLCATLVFKHNIDMVITSFLTNLNIYASAELPTVFRAIGKFCLDKKCATKLPFNDFIVKLTPHIKGSEPDKISLSLKLLRQMFFHKTTKLLIDKTLLIRLVELCYIDEYNDDAFECLCPIIRYHDVSLEGSGVLDLFVSIIRKEEVLSKNVLRVLGKLCSESAVRNRLKVEGFLPKLATYFEGDNVPKMTTLFLNFRYDKESIKILAKCPNFLSTLIDHSRVIGVLPILTVIAECEEHFELFGTKKNLIELASQDECGQLISTLLLKPFYCQKVIQSGIVWMLFNRKDKFELDVNQLPRQEELVKHMAKNGTDEEKKIIMLAAPFLMDSFGLFFFYVNHNFMDKLVELVVEGVTDDVLSAVIKWVEKFRGFPDIIPEADEYLSRQYLISDFAHEFDSSSDSSEAPPPPKPKVVFDKTDLTTFVFDDGSCAKAPKGLLCAHSPMFESMLNGNFAEANQERVKLSDCSSAEFNYLVKLLNEDIEPIHLDTSMHLNLISMTDRFLFADLCETLVNSLYLTEENHSEIFIWACNAGLTTHAKKLRSRSFASIVHTRQSLRTVLDNPDCGNLLLNEIKQYLKLTFDMYRSNMRTYPRYEDSSNWPRMASHFFHSTEIIADSTNPFAVKTIKIYLEKIHRPS